MGKKGKKAQAGKAKKLTPKDVGKRLDVLVRKLEEELKGADLFAPLPPTDDCAICLVPLPHVQSKIVYKGCCGNRICKACHFENEASIKKQNEEESAGKKIASACPFCREPVPKSDPEVRRHLHAACLRNDHIAITQMGNHYWDGLHEAPQDDLKALDCWIRAVELGSFDACTNIGNGYNEGKGVAINEGRTALFYRVGALRGSIGARHKIGLSDYESGNHEIAIRHWKIAAEAGYQPSLDQLKKIYNADGKMPGKDFISKAYLESNYRAGPESQMEIKNEEREKHRNDGVDEALQRMLKALSAD